MLEILQTLEFHQKLLETVPAGVALLNEKGDFIYVNPTVEKYMGYSLSELQKIGVRSPTWKVKDTHGHSLSPDQWAITKSLATQKPIEGEEISIETKDGKLLHVSISTHPFFDSTGKMVALMVFGIDRTKEKEGEKRLKEMVDRFELATLGSTDGIWDGEPSDPSSILSPESYVWWSPQFRNLLGYSSEEEFPNKLKSFLDHLHPDDFESLNRAVSHHLESNVPYNTDYRLRTKSGEYRWFNARGESIRNAENQILRMAGSIRDITLQKSAEEKLRESEQKFRQFAENIDEIFWMTDPEKSQMLYISPAYERVWGRSVESLYKHPKSFLEAIHPDDRQQVIDLLPLQLQGTSDVQYRIVRPDGTIRWVRDRAFPIRDAKGKVYRVCGIAEDITETKKHEHDLRLLANIVSMSVDAISTGGPDGIVTSWNKAAENIFGYTAKEIIGKDVRHFLVPPERHHESEMTLVKDPKAVMRMRTERLHKSGKRVPVMVTTFPMIDKNGRVYARAGIHQDLTFLAEMEKKLVDQSRMAGIGTMAAGIAHEIRNPLFGISSVAQLLVREVQGNQEIEQLGKSMLEEIARLNRMLKNLLLYARPKKAEFVEVRPNDLIEEFLNLYEPIRKEKQLRFNVRHLPLKAVVKADRDQMRQVVLNLVLNAIQAAPEGSSIEIVSKITSEKQWEFTIHNLGDPIPHEHLNTIFEPFFSTKTDGSGLGLSVCKKVIDDHLGRLWCDSSLENGTSFTFQIPSRLDEKAEYGMNVAQA